MEAKVSVTRPNPYEQVNFLNRNFFWWMNSFFWQGYRSELKVSDLYKCPRKDCSERLGGRLQKEWDKELKNKNKKPSLLRAMLRAFGFWYILSGSLSIIAECIIRVIQPIAMGYMVKFLEEYKNKTEFSEGNSTNNENEDYEYLMDNFYISAAIVCLLAMSYALAIHPYFFKMTRKGMQVRIACCNLIYRKALRLSRGALGRTTVGQMVNLLSNDVNRFDLSLIFIPFIFVGPIQTVIIIAYLWQYLDWTVLIGTGVLGFYVPFQFFMGRLFSKLRGQTAILTDERIRLMNEIVPAMRVIKMYTWEKPFDKLVEIARRNEVKVIKKTSILRGVNMALFFVSSKIMLFLCLMTFVLTGGNLTAMIVFVAMSLFNNLRTTMTLYFPYGIAQGSESLISISRLQHFLLLEEKDETCQINKVETPNKPSDCGVWMSDVVASWCPNQLNDQQEPTLNKLTFSVCPGELTVIVGSVGAGKSSVLMGVLGELPVLSGEVKVRGRVAYASQEAWSFAGTVRENVLFGSPFDEEKYRKVLHVCALEKDLNLFPYGDQTVVGERGVSLSGGQKARINLARALYLEADVYLLDDPLSAVDAAVAKHIFEKCIRGYLKDKVVILVTHQLQFIKAAHQILVLKDGKTAAIGPYHQLVNSGIDLIKLSGEEKGENQENQGTSMVKSSPYLERKRKTSGSTASVNSSVGGDEDEPAGIAGEAPQKQHEMAEMGSVKGAIYWLYVRAGAGCLLLFLLISSNLTTQILFNGSDYFLSLWTQREQAESEGRKSGTFVDDLDRNVSLTIYSCLVAGLFLFSLVRTTSFYTICMKASVTLHNRLFKSVIRAPISFFDNNPIGVLLNRCSRDMGIIDDMLPPTAFDAIEIFVNLFGVLILNAYIDYMVVVPTIILMVLFFFLRRFYIRTARSVKRLEGITRSPVFSHLANSLYGLATVRAFGAQKAFEVKFDKYQDDHTASWFLFISATRWFGIFLDWLCVLYVIAVTITLTLNAGDKTSSEIGLAISMAIMLTGMVQWGVRQSAELESQMTSVERVNEYSNLPSESNLEGTSGSIIPPQDWPEKGAIELNDVSLQYFKDDQPVLKNLTFSIKPKEKVGIVGRTGAGKSSMIATLFRMYEPTGTIKIDGIDTSQISLVDLRKKLSIIPQEPILFTGPVRRNIDPFNQHSDERLWEVLEEVQLKQAVIDMGGGLDASLSEGGSNFSVGQRQMICLARAILKQNKILVLDEATANVDPKTDAIIQKTIREKFANCTVLTIAHRLHTIMDADRVLVLDAGRKVEFDEPHTLLQNENGLFASMVRMTGKGMAQNLKETAKVAYDNRREASPYHQMQLEALQHNMRQDAPKHDTLMERGEDDDDDQDQDQVIRTSVL